jgi:hypothetical protein
VTLIDNNQVQLGSRKVIPLPRGFHDFRQGSTFFEYVFPFDQLRETHNRRDSEHSFIIWALTTESGTRCALNEDATLLTLPAGTFTSSRPITVVVQIMTRFVLCMRGPFSRAPSPLICVREDGSVVWELPAEYFGLGAVPNSTNIATGSGGEGFILAADTGEIISRQQSR